MNIEKSREHTHQQPRPGGSPFLAREIGWILELIGSPLWTELSEWQQQNWLNQLHLLKEQSGIH
jgi:hypothetical protein